MLLAQRRSIVDFFIQNIMLFITIVSIIPIILLWSYEVYGISIGVIIILLLATYTVITTTIGMVEALRNGQVGVDLLAVVAIISTVAVHEYWASWAIVLMIASGEAIENYAQSKAESNLIKLVQSAPQTAHIVSESDIANLNQTLEMTDFKTVDVAQVQKNDVLVVLPGEIVPVDGVLLSASAVVNNSAINGESLPVEVLSGKALLSGAVNGSTVFCMKATSVAKDSQYQRIIALVDTARNSRAPIVKTADIMALPFTVLSFAIAGIAWAVTGVPLRFAQVLVLATPCPLLISAPVACMAGTGRLARSGIIIKSQEILEELSRVTHVFFDKTGTLTKAKPEVIRVDLPEGETTQYSKNEILIYAGMLESYCVHILANGISSAAFAVLKSLQQEMSNNNTEIDGRDALSNQVSAEFKSIVQDFASVQVEQVKENSGDGVSGIINGHAIRVGRFAYATANEFGFQTVNKVTRFQELQADEMSAYVSIDGVLCGRIVLRDMPRKESSNTVEQLHALGIEQITMLTGDKKKSALTIAQQVGIDDVRYGLFPEDKVKAVQEVADSGVSMMVGDGVNDAPVLASANIGVAMTSGETTASSQTAQVVIMNDDISNVANAVIIARNTQRVLMQSIALGLGSAVICMLLAAFNFIPVVVGAFIQEIIDIVSILWALTAMREKD
ncbi:MAG: heavy metal translocating P-type ATPase [Bifidobacteriaceae bacterium]|nr:heavy metal translocating P-type ATPase [Bifidobacteriaceae bacterium]